MTEQNPGPLGEPIEYESVWAGRVHAKWRTGGMLFGVVAIVIGSISGFVGLLAPLSLLMPLPAGTPRQQPAAVLGAVALYGVVATSLIWLGIGAVMMRRWVRPMVLTVGTMFAVGGILGLISFAFVFPTMAATMTTAAAQTKGAMPPAGFFAIFVVVMMVMMGVFFVGIPGAFILFYRKQAVRAALEYYDPAARWTDDCPIPVLGLAVGLVIYALSALLAALQGIAPIFGTVVHGPAAVAIFLAAAVTAIVLAWKAYRVRASAWWGTIAFLLVMTLAYGVTALRSDQVELYRAAGLNDLQLQAMQGFMGIGILRKLAMGLPWLLVTCGYLAYVHKYFKHSAIP